MNDEKTLEEMVEDLENLLTASPPPDCDNHNNHLDAQRRESKDRRPNNAPTTLREIALAVDHDHYYLYQACNLLDEISKHDGNDFGDFQIRAASLLEAIG